MPPSSVRFSTRRWLLAAFTFLFLFLTVLHGTLPWIDAPRLDIQADLIGRAKCISESGNVFASTCSRLGYPIGDRIVQGYPEIAFLAILNTYLGIPLIDGAQIFNSLCLLLGILSLSGLVARFTRNVLAGLFSSLIFYGSTFLLRNVGFGSLYNGFLLFPFYVASSLWILHRIDLHIKPDLSDILRVLLLMILEYLILEFSVLMDGYSYVMAVSTTAVFLLASVLDSSWRQRGIDVRRLAVFVLETVLLLAPGIVYRFFDQGVSTPSFSLSFFRGEGIDVITMFVPTQQWLFARILHLGPAAWDAHAFYGDGNNANGNYLGITTVLCALFIVAMAVFKSIENRKVIIILAAVFLLGLVMSLGPSLKIDNIRVAQSTGSFQLEDYLMKPGDATVSLPSQWVFRLPIIRTMRATYRWQLLSRFALAILVGFLIAWLMARKAVLALLVCAIVIAENMPTAILSGQTTYQLYRQQGTAFDAQVVAPLRPYIEASTVLFLPAQNDFLATLIVPLTNSTSYNLSGDKEMAEILPLQPKAILGLESSYDRGTLRPRDICSVLKSGLVDEIVFTFFNLRWDAYSWPPTPKRIEEYREKAEGLGLVGLPGLKTYQSPLFMVVWKDSAVNGCTQ